MNKTRLYFARNVLTTTILAMLVSHPATAGSMDNDDEPCWGGKAFCSGEVAPKPMPSPTLRVLALSVGPAWTSSHESQTFYLRPGILKTYASDNVSNILGSAELFLAAQRKINKRFFWQLGVVVAADSDAKFSGDIWEQADPDFNNYNYKYGLNHLHAGAKGKLFLKFEPHVSGYISSTLGVGFNHSHGYVITPKIPEEVPSPAFGNNTVTALTYAFGIGVQADLNENWQTGFGYEFTSFGSSQLAQATGQTLNTGLKLSNLYTNALMITISRTM